MSNANKTQPEKASVTDFLDQQAGERKEDCYALMELFEKITKDKAVMWGSSIVGFGKYHYKYDSGREGDFFHIGFSPRKQSLSIYVMAGFAEESIMSRLGKFKTGKSCLYVKKLSDINLEVLTELAHFSMEKINKKYPS